MTDVEAIRARARAATAGPWQWFGSHRYPYLATPDRGRLFVMKFARSGMHGAQPMFRDPDPKPFGAMVKGSEVPVFEVCRDATSVDDPRVYRDDVVGFRVPDAMFIAHARQDVDDLLAEIDRLRGLLAGASE